MPYSRHQRGLWIVLATVSRNDATEQAKKGVCICCPTAVFQLFRSSNTGGGRRRLFADLFADSPCHQLFECFVICDDAQLWRRLMIDMPQFSHPLQPPLPRPVALTWTALTEGHWSLVVTKDTGSVAASLSPVEHAWSDNREYLIGALEEGWWLAVEVDGKLTTLASPFPSEEAARERAEALEADHR